MPEFSDRSYLMREEHTPTLQWMAQKARERIRRGRVALLENPATPRAYHLHFLEDLDGVEDGLLADALFEFIVGDQCKLGQSDRESGMAFRARTKLGHGRLVSCTRAIGLGLSGHEPEMGLKHEI